MTQARKLQLCSTRKGRIIIHLITFNRDHKISWHFKGIIRELKGI